MKVESWMFQDPGAPLCLRDREESPGPGLWLAWRNSFSPRGIVLGVLGVFLGAPFLTAYVFPPIVWVLTRRFAKTGVTPNQVTVVGIIACFAAIPFFAAGMWLPGLALGYLMAVLDSVDGKLARLTFTYSSQGDILDHGLDLVHPPLWYFAWAWGLAGGELQSPLVTASVWWFLFYLFDRVMEMLFKASTGQSIHGYTPLDVRMRTFISRRNTNMAVFTLALPLGLGVESFYLMVAWQGVCLAFHLSRVITYWNVDDPKASGA